MESGEAEGGGGDQFLTSVGDIMSISIDREHAEFGHIRKEYA